MFLRFVALALLCWTIGLPARAQTTFQVIGLDALRALDPTLTGSGVRVAQPEATSFTGNVDNNDFEVDPSAVNQPASLFTYINSTGSTATTFPNSVGVVSGHGNGVGNAFYGQAAGSNPGGVAPGVSHVDNYNANYFYNQIIVPPALGTPPSIPAKIVNQSFVFLSQSATIDQNYDNYAARYNTLFVSGAGNGGGVNSPASAYNGLAVGAYGGSSSVGPTTEGRSKPDLTAPGDATSAATPLVAGAAALLVQAGTRGDGGMGTAGAATDSRTLKALLLNGAVKPSDWTHTETAPLDPRYGAGILNVFNSYQQLRGGQQVVSASLSGSAAAVNAGTPVAREGWNLATITSVRTMGVYQDRTDHYLFDLTSPADTQFTLTSTVTWWRPLGHATINNLDLALYDATTGTRLAISRSLVDNVEQLYLPVLAAGRYDLAVVKNAKDLVTSSETYAIVFSVRPIPEPSSWLLVATGAIPLLARRRWR